MKDQPEKEIINRNLDTDAENPGVEVAETVADIEGKDATELATIYGCVDGALDKIFSNPPSPEAQMEMKFSYEGYRITIRQDGSSTFVKTEA